MCNINTKNDSLMRDITLSEVVFLEYIGIRMSAFVMIQYKPDILKLKL